jgi:hypothetical protein
LTDSPHTATDPQQGSIRKDFANVLNSDDRAEIVQALKGFVSAGRLAHFDCEKCKHSNTITVPDSKVRLDTLKFMVDQGLGKLLEEPAGQKLDVLRRQIMADIDNATDDELLQVLATEENPSPTFKGETDAVVDRWQSRHPKSQG